MDKQLPKNKTDLLKTINHNPIFFTIGIGIILLVIAIFIILFKVSVPTTSSSTSTPSSVQSIASNIMIILFFMFLIIIGAVSLLPSLKEFKEFLLQILNVTYVILYTIFLILFFRLVPSDIINKYASIITPVTILLSIFMFYKAFEQNYAAIFNVNYERIKTIILFFCMITLFILYYITDPGGYITKYFGYSAVLTIVMSIFILLYLILLITIPNTSPVGATPSGKNSSAGTGTGTNQMNNLLGHFSNFSVWGSISFLAFIIIVTFAICTSGFTKDVNIDTTNTNTFASGIANFLQNKTESAAVIILLLIVTILWSILLTLNVFPEFPNMPSPSAMSALDKMNYFKKALLILFGLVISGLIIAWITYNVQHLSSSSSIFSLILNIFLIIIVLALIYKTIFVQMPVGNSQKNAFFNLLLNTLFYIPCLFSESFDYMMKTFSSEYNATTMSSVYLLLIAIVLLVVYNLYPYVYNKINLQGGKLLVNQPVYTNTNYALGTYKDLNGNDDFNYEYAISFWFFLDAVPPNMSKSSTEFTSLLNFGNKPNVLYNAQTNTLQVTMQSGVNVYDNAIDSKKQLTALDDNQNTIIYTNSNVLLQKWNNLIINYNGGIVDIFLNGELVKSVSGVVPYYTLDNLTIGEDDGVNGGICNVVYFQKPLTSINIYYLYNMVKNMTPPVAESSNYTIIKDKLTVDSVK
jgi:hypothetical protein